MTTPNSLDLDLISLAQAILRSEEGCEKARVTRVRHFEKRDPLRESSVFYFKVELSDLSDDPNQLTLIVDFTANTAHLSNGLNRVGEVYHDLGRFMMSPASAPAPKAIQLFKLEVIPAASSRREGEALVMTAMPNGEAEFQKMNLLYAIKIDLATAQTAISQFMAKRPGKAARFILHPMGL